MKIQFLLSFLILFLFGCAHSLKPNRTVSSVNLYSQNQTLLFTDKSYNTVEVYIFNTKEQLTQYVNFRRAFCVFELSDENNQKSYFIAFTKWLDPEKTSSHYYIEEAVQKDFQMNHYLSGYKLQRIEKGYIQPKNGEFEVYDLAGASLYDYSGYSGDRLSKSAEIIKSIFYRTYKVFIRFAPSGA